MVVWCSTIWSTKTKYQKAKVEIEKPFLSYNSTKNCTRVNSDLREMILYLQFETDMDESQNINCYNFAEKSMSLIPINVISGKQI